MKHKMQENNCCRYLLLYYLLMVLEEFLWEILYKFKSTTYCKYNVTLTFQKFLYEEHTYKNNGKSCDKYSRHAFNELLRIRRESLIHNRIINLWTYDRTRTEGRKRIIFYKNKQFQPTLLSISISVVNSLFFFQNIKKITQALWYRTYYNSRFEWETLHVLAENVMADYRLRWLWQMTYKSLISYHSEYVWTVINSDDLEYCLQVVCTWLIVIFIFTYLIFNSYAYGKKTNTEDELINRAGTYVSCLHTYSGLDIYS